MTNGSVNGKNDNIYITYEICQNDTLTKNKIKEHDMA